MKYLAHDGVTSTIDNSITYENQSSFFRDTQKSRTVRNDGGKTSNPAQASESLLELAIGHYATL